MDLDGSLNAESASSGLYKLIWMQDGRLNRAQDALIPTLHPNLPTAPGTRNIDRCRVAGARVSLG
jgi:hypothetical protein